MEACYPESRTLVVVLSNLETSPVKQIADRLAAFAFGEETGKADSEKSGTPVGVPDGI